MPFLVFDMLGKSSVGITHLVPKSIGNKANVTQLNLSADNVFKDMCVCVCAAENLLWTAAWVNAISLWGVMTHLR